MEKDIKIEHGSTPDSRYQILISRSGQIVENILRDTKGEAFQEMERRGYGSIVQKVQVPAVGSAEYFNKMPVEQVRREIKIYYDRYRELEKQYFELRSRLANFKNLLDESDAAFGGPAR